MRPAGLVTVCNDIVPNGRRRVVELGSGISTVLLARLLCQRWPLGGFRIAAVEHDTRWALWVTEQLDREGIGSDVVVVHAPPAPHPRAEPGLSWYDDAAVIVGLRAALRGDPIDLLLVDGPPAYAAGRGLARYPACPSCGTGSPPARPSSSTTSSGPGSRRSCDGGSARPGSTSTVGPAGPAWRWPGLAAARSPVLATAEQREWRDRECGGWSSCEPSARSRSSLHP
jgi:hypothetical protein